MLLSKILLIVPLAAAIFLTTPSPSTSSSLNDQLSTNHVGHHKKCSSVTSPATATLQHQDQVSVLLPQPTETSPTDTACPPSYLSCGSSGCFDPNTHKCCLNETNFCEKAHNCVEVQRSNGTIAHGCCSFGTTCGEQCIDPAIHKCCTLSGGGFGSCPAGIDCCGDLCCDEGRVCAKGSDGHRCWPTNSGNASHTTGTESSASSGAMATILPSVTSGSKRLLVPQSSKALFILLRFAAALSTLDPVVNNDAPAIGSRQQSEPQSDVENKPLFTNTSLTPPTQEGAALRDKDAEAITLSEKKGGGSGGHGGHGRGGSVPHHGGGGHSDASRTGLLTIGVLHNDFVSTCHVIAFLALVAMVCLLW